MLTHRKDHTIGQWSSLDRASCSALLPAGRMHSAPETAYRHPFTSTFVLIQRVGALRFRSRRAPMWYPAASPCVSGSTRSAAVAESIAHSSASFQSPLLKKPLGTSQVVH